MIEPTGTHMTDWKCLKCNYTGFFGTDVIIDIRMLPKSGLEISIICCPDCGDAQALKIHGCVDQSKIGDFCHDLDELSITNWECTNCNENGMRLGYDAYPWGFKLVPSCDKCREPQDSRFTQLVPFCGKSVQPHIGRGKPNPNLRPFFDEMCARLGIENN